MCGFLSVLSLSLALISYRDIQLCRSFKIKQYTLLLWSYPYARRLWVSIRGREMTYVFNTGTQLVICRKYFNVQTSGYITTLFPSISSLDIKFCLLLTDTLCQNGQCNVSYTADSCKTSENNFFSYSIHPPPV